MVDYITNKDTIIFSLYYNGLIDIILSSKYNKIIFSDYELNEKLFEKYEKINFNGCNFIGSKFNQKVELPKKLTRVKFFGNSTF